MHMQKQRSILYFIAGIVFSISCISVSGQLNSSSPLNTSGEHVEIFTDRSIYGVGEKIHFSTVCSKPEGIPAEWSKIMYAELIRWNGAKIASVKVPLVHGSGKGSLDVPASLETGVYYLRAYTKWMRNFSPYDYSYLTLRVVNPISSRTERGPAEQGELRHFDSLEIQSPKGIVEFRNIKELYGTREPVEMLMQAHDDYLPGTCNLSVVRTGSFDIQAASYRPGLVSSAQEEFKLEYYPEIRGLSLSGKLVNKETKEPVRQSRVDLSSVSDAFYFASAKTGDDGSFLFTFPQTSGTHEFHLTNEGETNVSFLIDADFCKRPVSLPYIPFQMSEDERELIADIVTNSQIEKNFMAAETNVYPEDSARLAFYGTPTRIIYEKDFIELVDLQEFLFELVYEVTVRERDGEKKIFFNGQSTLSSYPPLILLDNIPVRNIDELLKVGCRRIDRIELLNAGYVMGYFLHSGIISIYSEGKDMAGMKQGENSNFFSLDLFEYPEQGFPEYKGEHKLSRVPDLRSTLCWEPSLEIKKGESKSIHFYTGDAKGEYTVYLSGIDSAGNRVVTKGPVFRVQ